MTTMITEVSINIAKPPQNRDETPLRGFAGMTVDGWLRIADMRIIHARGRLFVSCPTRHDQVRCAACHKKHNHANTFCPCCGTKCPPRAERREARPPTRPEWFDIVHPIDFAGRRNLESAILAAYRQEEKFSRHPDYLFLWADYQISWDSWPNGTPSASLLRHRASGSPS